MSVTFVFAMNVYLQKNDHFRCDSCTSVDIECYILLHIEAEQENRKNARSHNAFFFLQLTSCIFRCTNFSNSPPVRERLKLH